MYTDTIIAATYNVDMSTDGETCVAFCIRRYILATISIKWSELSRKSPFFVRMSPFSCWNNYHTKHLFIQ